MNHPQTQHNPSVFSGSPVPEEVQQTQEGLEQQPIQEQIPQQPQPQSSFGPVYFNGRRFETQEELVAFLAQQEQELQFLRKNTTMAQQAQPVYQPQVPTTPQKRYSDLLFEDPDTAARLIKEEAKQEIWAEYTKQRTEEQTWTKFYQDNPDLKGFEKLVDAERSYVVQNRPEIANAPLEVGLSHIAKEVRTTINKARQTDTAGARPLPQGQARTAGVSGGQIPQPQQQPPIPTDFASQLRKIQSRGRIRQ